MNKWFEKNISTVIAIFLLLQPILDLLTGICVNTLHITITIGIIVRLVFLFLLCFITIFIFKKKKLIIPYLIIGLYFVLYIIGIITNNDTHLLKEIQNLARTFYFPILLITLYSIKDHIKISNMTLFTMVLTYLVLIFIPTLFGVGYKSYQITKAGTLGFFNSANEISGIISILTPIIFVIFFQSKKKIPILVFSIIYLVVILMIGTKTPLLTLGITIGISMLYLWRYFIIKREWIKIIISALLVLSASLALIIIIPKTNFYKNIKTHLDYLGLEHVTEVFQDEELIDHFIFSSRIKFLKNKDKIYNKSNLYQKVFGTGYYYKNKVTKLIEMDYFDIFYSHGLVGFIIYFVPVLYILYKLLEKRKKHGYENLMCRVALFLIIFLAFFTGHIITAPAVSLIVIIELLGISKRTKKELLFTGYSLKVGGIEKAQLCLFNNINYNKYNVTLILERKEGELLKKVNNKVCVKECKVSENKNIIIRKTINLYRKLIFKIFNYNNFDFSCCYTTYSYSGNKLAKLSSTNSCFYVHSDYKYVYKDEKEFREFFDTRKISEYKKIVFVSKESEKSFLEVYPNLKEKTLVLNNFIDIKDIIKKSRETIDIKKNKDKKLFVFVGRLDDSSKKLKRALNIIKNIKDTELWIVGDGPDRQMYEEYVAKSKLQESVTFVGMKLNPYPYMAKADYIILTSDYEGFPVTYLEALVLKKQIITTIPTSDDALDMNDLAYIISKDEKKMINEIKDILKSDSKKRRVDLEKIQEFRKERLEILFND